MKLTVKGLKNRSEVAELMAGFGQPIDRTTREYLKETGLDDTQPVGCMAWIWCQWLLGAPKEEILKRAEAFVDRGMEMQKISPHLRHRPAHDLYLLHCAIFASTEAQLQKLAQQVVDASGYRNHTPRDDGELYESAWCGMLKHWIIGDRKKAAQQADVVWRAYRFPNLRAATKPLVTPWLKEDWKAFSKQQQKDFDTYWQRARKDRTVLKRTSKEIVVEAVRYVQQLWCWAHCGMALLAYRRGIDVVTDPFWLPPHALKCVPRDH